MLTVDRFVDGVDPFKMRHVPQQKMWRGPLFFSGSLSWNEAQLGLAINLFINLLHRYCCPDELCLYTTRYLTQASYEDTHAPRLPRWWGSLDDRKVVITAGRGGSR